MTKADLLAGLAARPVPFAVAGLDVLLRPLRFGDRRELLNWFAGNRDAPGLGLAIQRRYVTMAVSDAAGGLLLADADIDALDASVVMAIADEVARRNGLDGDPKATSPGTAS